MKNHDLKKKLFDGDQEDLIRFCWSTLCPNCKAKISFKTSDAFSLSQARRDTLEIIIEKIPKLKIISLGDVRFFTFESLPVYYFNHECSNCFQIIIMVAGMGEYQPARYLLIGAGLFLIDNRPCS